MTSKRPACPTCGQRPGIAAHVTISIPRHRRDTIETIARYYGKGFKLMILQFIAEGIDRHLPDTNN